VMLRKIVLAYVMVMALLIVLGAVYLVGYWAIKVMAGVMMAAGA